MELAPKVEGMTAMVVVAAVLPEGSWPGVGAVPAGTSEGPAQHSTVNQCQWAIACVMIGSMYTGVAAT